VVLGNLRWLGSPSLRVAVGFVAALLLLLPACGKSRIPTYPTEGKLLIKGKPYPGVSVLLEPLKGRQKDVPLPRGNTEADGTFKLTTFAKYDGAPEGEYKVLVIYDPIPSPFARKRKRPPPFNSKFSKLAETPLRTKVEAIDKNVLPTIEIP
jgi:hypothetical protein